MTNQELIKILSGMLKVSALTKKELLEHMAIEQVIEMLKEDKQ